MVLLVLLLLGAAFLLFVVAAYLVTAPVHPRLIALGLACLSAGCLIAVLGGGTPRL